ncbi:hypothetical protein FACS189499_10420 [Clostridia bacterium]|nr:hypothetical protein FACS189499_10420 [Clostridia bacterium]
MCRKQIIGIMLMFLDFLSLFLLVLDLGESYGTAKFWPLLPFEPFQFRIKWLEWFQHDILSGIRLGRIAINNLFAAIAGTILPPLTGIYSIGLIIFNIKNAIRLGIKNLKSAVVLLLIVIVSIQNVRMLVFMMVNMIPI